MKKLLTIALALVIALSLTAVPAFAGNTLPEQVTQVPAVQGDSPKSAALDVYGYVGEDVKAIENDNPGIKVVKYQVNVSVPTKIIWAAFEGDKAKDNNITAPSYTITNNSEKNALKVTLESFQPVDANADANTAVDANLVLNITGADGKLGVIKNVVDKDGSSSKYPISASTTEETGTLAARPTMGNDSTNVWTFSLGGKYSGDYTTAYEPTYTMTLKFALASA